ncbi:MAG: hypothetical protein KDA22_16160, partial [Phycisphaerales bacterium]|nr:hypothetical protein [Phycisphaerales bacterium]
MTAPSVDGAVGARRWWHRQRWRRLLPIVVAALVLLVALLAIGRDVERHLSGIEHWVADLGPWGILGFVVVFVVLTSAFVPESLLAVVAGTVFGLAWGAFALVAGGLVAAGLHCGHGNRVLQGHIVHPGGPRPRIKAMV